MLTERQGGNLINIAKANVLTQNSTLQCSVNLSKVITVAVIDTKQNCLIILHARTQRRHSLGDLNNNIKQQATRKRTKSANLRQGMIQYLQ